MLIIKKLQQNSVIKNEESSYWKNTGYDYFGTGIGLHHVTFDYHNNNNDNNNNYYRHNLIHNSMMKCGSTSINRALKELEISTKERYFNNYNDNNNNNNNNNNNTIQVIYQGNQNNLMAKQSQILMKDLYNYQQQQEQQQQQQTSERKNNNSTTVTTTTTTTTTFQYFTTVRDPVLRFVSAIAQEMYVRGGNNNKESKAKKFRTKCLLETPQKTLECSIKHVKDMLVFGKQRINQPHFIPMTTILYKRSYGYNVSVLVVPITMVSTIVKEMIAPSRQIKLFSKMKRNTLKAQGSTVLKNMTVNHLTESMINEICQLYQLDVEMMIMLGLPTLCNNTQQQQHQSTLKKITIKQ